MPTRLGLRAGLMYAIEMRQHDLHEATSTGPGPVASRLFAEGTGRVYLMRQPRHPKGANLVPGAGYGVVIPIGKERSRSFAMRPTEAFFRVEIDRLLKDAAST